MTTLNLKLAILIIVSCAALSSCSRIAGNSNVSVANGSSEAGGPANNNAQGPAPNGPYPQEVADEFLSSCEEAGSDAAFCKCMLEKVQAKYSFEEFSVIEAKLTAGKPPDEFIEFSGKARAECMKGK
jgi:hypothetical protein